MVVTKTPFVSQIIGPVLDIKFLNGDIPKRYNALIVLSEHESITCEVQQLLGDKKVRAVSMNWA